MSIGHQSTEGPWQALVEQARWAPSPHNTQPWVVRPTSATEAELLVPRERLLPVEDPQGRFMTAAIGIFVEALDVAAAADGLCVRHECEFPDLGAGADPSARFARLRLEPRDEPPAGDVASLERRRTSRRPYDGRPVSDDVVARCAQIAGAWGHEFRASNDPRFVRWVLDLNTDTVFDDLDEEDRRREIAGWIRTSERAARAAGDGFSPRALGFPGPLLGAFFFHHRITAARPFRPALRAVFRRSMRGTATVGWIRGPFSAPADCFEAGRMLMRLWLALAEHDVRLHPFGSIITNPRSHARLAARLGAGGEIWLLVRLGRSDEPARSHRLTGEQVMA